MTDAFYRAFEERHRGPRELIKSRLQVYVPFVEPLKAAYAGGMAVDLGCGRGEWLELVNELGFDGVGVDMDEGMLAACHELDLNVERKEAVAYLKSLPDASTAIVSGFHVAEHIVFSELQSLVQEALRVLRPGGLLILETPNPENMLVAGVNFYLDPTHQRPIPPQLLSFLPEHYGFERVKILRLQEAAGLADSNALTLLNVLNGVSPDYAVVAQKTGADDILAATEPAFTAEYGISLDTLAAKYEQQRKTMAQKLQARAEIAEIKTLLIEVNSRTERAEAKAQLVEANARAQVTEAITINKTQQAEARAQQAEAKSIEMQSALDALRQELHDVHQANHHHWQLAEARNQQIQALLNSNSWRVTAPLRGVITWLRKMPGVSEARAIAKESVGHAIRYVVLRPGLKRLAVGVLRPFPGIVTRLRNKRAAQLRADFLALRPTASNSNQAVGHLSGMTSQTEDSLAFLNAVASRELSIDEILQRIRAELAETQMEK